MDGTCERTIRTISDMTLTTLIHSGLPKNMWGYAGLHAVEVINRTSESILSNKKQGFNANPSFSRMERWRNKALPEQASCLYPFGCLAFKFINPELRTKLDAKAIPSVFLGLDAKSRCYRLGAVEVTFVEDVFPFRFCDKNSTNVHLWSTEDVAQREEVLC